MLYTFSLPNSIVFLLNISFPFSTPFVMYVISIFTVVMRFVYVLSVT